MSSLSRRSPSLESVSSVRSFDSMNSFDSVHSLDELNSFENTHSSNNIHWSPRGAESDSLEGPFTPTLNAPSARNERREAVVDPSVPIAGAESGRDWPRTVPPVGCGPPSSPVGCSTKTSKHDQYFKHGRYYLDTRSAEFVLDDGTLYRVFRHSFEAHSPVFAKRYFDDGDREDGEPIQLAGVSRVDFDRLLSLMYPSELATCPLTTPAEWISVLRLATLWSFSSLRKRAVGELGRIGSAIDKICAAREFDGDSTVSGSSRALSEAQDGVDEVLRSWLMPAFKELCTAPDWLSHDDAERLGLHTVVELARIKLEMAAFLAHKLDMGGSGRQTETVISMYDVAKAIVEAGLATALKTGFATAPQAGFATAPPMGLAPAPQTAVAPPSQTGLATAPKTGVAGLQKMARPHSPTPPLPTAISAASMMPSVTPAPAPTPTSQPTAPISSPAAPTSKLAALISPPTVTTSQPVASGEAWKPVPSTGDPTPAASTVDSTLVPYNTSTSVLSDPASTPMQSTGDLTPIVTVDTSTPVPPDNASTSPTSADASTPVPYVDASTLPASADTIPSEPLTPVPPVDASTSAFTLPTDASTLAPPADASTLAPPADTSMSIAPSESSTPIALSSEEKAVLKAPKKKDKRMRPKMMRDVRRKEERKTKEQQEREARKAKERGARREEEIRLECMRELAGGDDDFW